jgi:uncharacterized protein (DUF2344 family)
MQRCWLCFYFLYNFYVEHDSFKEELSQILKRDLQIPTVKQEARKYSTNYRKRLDAHPNNLANALFKEQLGNRRLKRLYPADLVTNG